MNSKKLAVGRKKLEKYDREAFTGRQCHCFRLHPKKKKKLPLLSSLSKNRLELYLYIAVPQATVSAALVREEDESQRLVYFTAERFEE